MNKRAICLFDIDGTLTKPRNVLIYKRLVYRKIYDRVFN